MHARGCLFGDPVTPEKVTPNKLKRDSAFDDPGYMTPLSLANDNVRMLDEDYIQKCVRPIYHKKVIKIALDGSRNCQ